ncbi:MAG: BMP family ABC transporter substrate-binding protein [Treponema sp.]|nr:BMP family ABC transporter substrate-binding protein [Treponema sp.]
MKKFVIAAMALALTGLVFTSCNGKKEGETKTKKFKAGFIYIGDENEGYTEAHMNGVKEMKAALGLSDDQIIEKTLIPEAEAAYDAAIDLIDQGCSFVVGTSFGHESYLIQAAKEHPEVQFSHSTGYQAGLSGLKNMHNFMPSVYQSRYVSGIVAGLKLQEMIDTGKITAAQAKIGYVGAYPYAEVVSGYTSFFLGARSVCPSATMEVRYTNSWADMALEKETADALIAAKCVLISQHADTTGAPSSCEAAGVPIVGYNVDMIKVAPNTALTSAALNWGAYYTFATKAVMNGESLPVDWSKGYDGNAVYITALNDKTIAAGTKAAVDTAIAGLKDGSLKVFSTDSFTIGGKTIEALIAEGGDWAKYADLVKDGYFHEQENASSPAFDLRIDGITEAAN